MLTAPANATSMATSAAKLSWIRLRNVGMTDFLLVAGRLKFTDRGKGLRFPREALGLYQQIPEPYGIGMASLALAQISKGEERAGHLAAARKALRSIGRADLVAELDVIESQAASTGRGSRRRAARGSSP
jgi:hypothetical protein